MRTGSPTSDMSMDWDIYDAAHPLSTSPSLSPADVTPPSGTDEDEEEQLVLQKSPRYHRTGHARGRYT